jgi:dolichyldiphosphatase
MPSTHSTALSFYFFYLFPFILSSHISTPLRISGVVGLAGYWIGGLWSRVELGYHDYKQVSAGVALGIILAGMWRGLWEYGGFQGHLQWLEDITLGRIFGSL